MESTGVLSKSVPSLLHVSSDHWDLRRLKLTVLTNPACLLIQRVFKSAVSYCRDQVLYIKMGFLRLFFALDCWWWYHRETLGRGENEKLSILALLWHFLTFLSQSSSWQMCWFCVIKVIKTKKMISLIFKEDQENQHVNIGSSKFCHFCFKKLNYLNSYPLIFCHLTHQLSDWLFQL